MSLWPLLLSTWWADLGYPPAMDQNFGHAALLPPEELLFPRAFDQFSPFVYNRGVLDFYKPWLRDFGRSGITIDDNTFKVIIDVQQFKPEEVSVKVVDRFLVVEAKHEEKQDEHGSITRQFARKYLLPNRADLDQLKSTISSDGILTITAPLKPEEPKDERVIKIEQTGQPAFRPSEDGSRTTEASAIVSTEKKGEENEIREEVTTQAQQETEKPEK